MQWVPTVSFHRTIDNNCGADRHSVVSIVADDPVVLPRELSLQIFTAPVPRNRQ